MSFSWLNAEFCRDCRWCQDLLANFCGILVCIFLQCFLADFHANSELFSLLECLILSCPLLLSVSSTRTCIQVQCVCASAWSTVRRLTACEIGTVLVFVQVVFLLQRERFHRWRASWFSSLMTSSRSWTCACQTNLAACQSLLT